jgi:hypothetical protein
MSLMLRGVTSGASDRRSRPGVESGFVRRPFAQRYSWKNLGFRVCLQGSLFVNSAGRIVARLSQRDGERATIVDAPSSARAKAKADVVVEVAALNGVTPGTRWRQ